MFLIFINIGIVEKLKYTNGVGPVASLNSELLHRYLLFLFFAGTSFNEHFVEAAFEAVLIISEIELAMANSFARKRISLLYSFIQKTNLCRDIEIQGLIHLNRDIVIPRHCFRGEKATVSRF